MRAPDNTIRQWRDPQRRTVLMVVLCATALALVLSQQRSLEMTRRLLSADTGRLSKMKIDAAHIVELQSRPQQAVDREKPNAELLAQVETALSESNVPRELWQDSIPQPPQRSKGSDYLQVATRLEFEGVTVRQIIVFAKTLLRDDPTLAVQSLRLRNLTRSTESEGCDAPWVIEITIGYFIYDLKMRGS